MFETWPPFQEALEKWWLLISVLEIILGISCIIRAIKYKFNERFNSVRESYMNPHFSFQTSKDYTLVLLNNASGQA